MGRVVSPSMVLAARWCYPLLHVGIQLYAQFHSVGQVIGSNNASWHRRMVIYPFEIRHMVEQALVTDFTP